MLIQWTTFEASIILLIRLNYSCFEWDLKLSSKISQKSAFNFISASTNTRPRAWISPVEFKLSNTTVCSQGSFATSRECIDLGKNRRRRILILTAEHEDFWQTRITMVPHIGDWNRNRLLRNRFAILHVYSSIYSIRLNISRVPSFAFSFPSALQRQ